MWIKTEVLVENNETNRRTILMLFNKVSRKRQIKHYGEWFAGGDLDYFGQSSYPIACISFFQTCLLGSL